MTNVPNQDPGKDAPPPKEQPAAPSPGKGPLPRWQQPSGDPKAVVAKLQQLLANGRDELTKTFGPAAGKPLNRREALWPYLLMRAWLPSHLFPDVDQGQRPARGAQLSQWGPLSDLDVIDGTAVRVRVWNLGRVPAIGARVRVFFAYSHTTTEVLNGTPIDSEMPPEQAAPAAPTSDRAYVRLAAQTYLDVDAVDSGRCTTIATLPLTLTHDIVASATKTEGRFAGWSTGHLVTVVDSVMDVAGGFFNAEADRHVTSWQPLPLAFPTR